MIQHYLVIQTMAPSTTFSLSLNTFGVSDSSTSLGSPFQCLVTLSVKKLPLLSNLNTLSLSLCPLVLGEEIDLHLVTPSFQVAVESEEVSSEPPFLPG